MRTALSYALLITIVLGTCGTGAMVYLAQPKEAPKDNSLPAMELQDTVVNLPNMVEVYYQYPEYPAGCELASLCQVLRAWGYDANIQEFIDEGYMNFSDTDWVMCYYGNIKGTGFCFPPAIVIAAQNYLQTVGDKGLVAYDITGHSWDNYMNYLQQGYPVITWYTIDYKDPNFYKTEQLGCQPWSNLHCIVAYATEDGQILIADPIAGYVSVDRDKFRQIWQACGEYACVVIPEAIGPTY